MVTGRVKLLPFPVSISGVRVHCHPTSLIAPIRTNTGHPVPMTAPPYEKNGLFDCNSYRSAEIIESGPYQGRFLNSSF